MPTYEYKCRSCGHQFEVFQKITAKAGARCPKCRAKAERQVSGGTGFVFKGSGFYITDYKRQGQKPEGEAGKGEKAGPGDSKPADQKPAEQKPGEKKPNRSGSESGSKPRKDD